MARITAFVQTARQSSGPSTLPVVIPSNEEGDLVLVCLSNGYSHASNNPNLIFGVGSTGFTWLGPATQSYGSNGGASQFWFGAVAGAGGISSTQSFPVSSSETSEAVAIVIKAGTHNGLSGIHWQRIDFNNVAQVASSSVSASSNSGSQISTSDALLLYSIVFDAAVDIRATGNVIQLGGSTTATGQSSYVGFRQGSSSSAVPPTITWWGSVNTEGGQAWVLAIENATSGDRQPWVDFGATPINLGGNIGAFQCVTTANESASTITGGATIAGVTADTYTPAVATTLSAMKANSPSGNESSIGTWGSATLTSDKYTGVIQTLPAAVDLSTDTMMMHYSCPQFNNSNEMGDNGMGLMLVDGSGNWVLHRVVSKRKWIGESESVKFIDFTKEVGLIDKSAGAITLSNITKMGPVAHRLNNCPTTYLSWRYKNIIKISEHTFLGGSAADPITPQWLYNALTDPYCYAGNTAATQTMLRSWSNSVFRAAARNGATQCVFFTPIRIGNGADYTYFDARGAAVTFPKSYSYGSPVSVEVWAGAENSCGVTVDPASGDTIILGGCQWTCSQEQPLTIDAGYAGGATVTTDAGVIAGPWVVTWNSAVSASTLAFDGVKSVDGKSASFAGCSFVRCSLAGGAYLALDGGAEIDYSDAPFVSSSFALGSEDYAIECRTAGYYDFSDSTFSGYTNDLYINVASGDVTIRLAEGQAEPSYVKVGGSTATVTFDSPAVTRGLNFTDLVAGTQVKVFNTGTDVERFSTDSSGTSETWSEATTGSVTVDYTIMKAGYRPIRVTGVTVTGAVSGGVLATPIQQQIDRAYVASSGLTYATNTTATAGATKQFGLTADSTLQNYYSHMIEVWIAQGAEGGDFANTQFPITPNGSTSFSFDYGWEWDGATSIAHLSRDGMRYKNASGTVTAMWAAILTSGVPAGKQVRYQQQDGLGTTNAANTGNMDELVQIYGDATHGNFDYTDWLVLKVQAASYDQAEAVAADIYGTLEDQLYVFGLTPLPDEDATWSADATVTVTAEATPVEWPAWSGKYFSTTITDTTDGHSGLQILRAVRAENEFNWSDLVRPNGSKFKTVTGNFYGDAYTTPAGVRVVLSDGTTPHPDFDLFSDDTAADPYVPPQSAPITWASCPTGATVLLYNDSDAGAIIDTQTGVTGGYSLAITLPHADVAVGDTLRLRYGHADYYAGELQGTMTADGLAFVGTATSHPIYAAWGLTGADYDQANGGPYTMDGANLQIDISVAGTVTGLKTQLAAWTQYLMTLPAGLDAFYGAWDLLAANQIRQNVDVVDVLLDLPTAGAVFTLTDNNVNYYRSDFTYPAYVGTGHGLVAMTYDASPFVATVAGGDVVTGTPETVAAAVRAALNTELARISDLAKRGGVVSGTPVVIPPGDGSIVAGDVEIDVSTAEDGTVTLARV